MNQVKTPIQHNDLELCKVNFVSLDTNSSQSGALLSRGHTEWKEIRQSALQDRVSWRTERQSSYTKSRR